jgi:hypothetical protein
VFTGDQRTGRRCPDLPLIEEEQDLSDPQAFDVRNIDGLEALNDVVASIQSLWRGFSARATLEECQFAATVEDHPAVDDYEIEVEHRDEEVQEEEEVEEEEGEEAMPPRRSARIAALAATTAAEEYGCQPRLRWIPRVSCKGMC